MTDKFSFSRFDLIWAYYSPAIMRQWIWTIAAVIVMFGLILLARLFESVGLFSMINTLLFFPVYLGPLVFTIYNDRSMQIQLPATAAEKATFYILHSLVIMPAAVAGLWLSLNSLSGVMFGYDNGVYGHFMSSVLDDFTHSGIDLLSTSFIVQRMFMELLPVAVVLLTVLVARSHRVIKGVGAAIGTLLAYGVVSGVLGFFVAINEARHVAAVAAINDGGEEMALQVASEILSRLLSILTVISGVSLVVCIILIYRCVRRMQA
ncbi:MAG: hypothetical protein K2L77_08500 [Muribaculaceae bacterium]|nr:hypothetical protein [Muribaculaceae bacterium]